jgi:hypothetical protein
MLPIVQFPGLVERYAPYFVDAFSDEALIEFKRYLSGLIVSENKTVDGINRLCVMENRNQSSLNRLLTASPVSLDQVNRARLQVLADIPETRLKPNGVLSLDNTLLMHYGQQFEEIAKLYDHVSGTYVWAHDLVTLQYSDDHTDYPLAFELWKPLNVERLETCIRTAGIKMQAGKEKLKDSDPLKWRSYLHSLWQRRHTQWPELEQVYASKLIIARRLVQAWVSDHPDLKLPVTFDSWFTQPELCRYIDRTLKLAYVGTRNASDKILLKTGEQELGQFAEQLKQEHLDGKSVFRRLAIAYKGEQEVYYSYCNTHRLPGFGKQRLVINYRHADLSDTPVFYISNRLKWQAPGMTRIRRHRWPVEVYHEEGKAEGLDQYQLREFNAIQRHVAFVAVVYSLLRAAQYDTGLHRQIQRQLKITFEGHPAAVRRTVDAQNLWNLALLIRTGLSLKQTLDSILAPLLRAIAT